MMCALAGESSGIIAFSGESELDGQMTALATSFEQSHAGSCHQGGTFEPMIVYHTCTDSATFL